MTLDPITSILVLTAPALTSALAIIAGFFKFVKIVKGFMHDSDTRIDDFELKNKKAYDDIAVVKTKLACIEQYLMDKEGKK